MIIETILNAHTLTVYMMASGHQHHERRYRQRDAFRTRILRMFEEKDRQLAILEEDKWNLKEEILCWRNTLLKETRR